MRKISFVSFVILVMTVDLLATPGKKQLTLKFSDSSNGKYDITHIYLDMGRSPLFNPTIPPPPQPEDALKQFDTAMAMPQICSYSSDNIACYSNGYGPFDSTTVVRLGIRVEGGHSYTFTAELMDNFDPTSIILIEDRLNGVFQDLRQGEYTVNLAQAQMTEDRFYIHISYPPVIEPTPSGCTNDDGIISITQDSFILWSECLLYDSNLNFITSFTSIRGNMNFPDLKEGTYNIVFLYGSYAAIKPVKVLTHQITTKASASKYYAAVNEVIQFYSQAKNSTSYKWDFGDSTEIIGIANPQVSYPVAGIYTVTLHCSNSFGCDAYEYLTVYIGVGSSIGETQQDIATVTVVNRNLMIHMQEAASFPGSYEVFSISGQLLSAGPVADSNTGIDLSGQPAGIYVVRLQGNKGNFIRKFFLE